MKRVRLAGFCVGVAFACIGSVTANAQEGSRSALVISTGDAAIGSKTNTATPDPFTGTFSYPIPIEVPQGRGGMNPELFLTYRSDAGNSWTGIGWVLELGSVERRSRRGIDFAGNDFVLKNANGTSELVQTADGEYRARIDGAFTRVRRVTGRDGRVAFEATDRSGVRYFYGYGPESRLADPADANRILKWCLEKVTDTNGNTMYMTYQQFSPGEIYPSEIRYTGYETSGSASVAPAVDAPNKSVKFYLETRPYYTSNPGRMFVSGFELNANRLLKTIDVLADGKRQRTYQLRSGWRQATPKLSATTWRSLLTEVVQYGRDVDVDQNTGDITVNGSEPGPEHIVATTSVGWNSASCCRSPTMTA